VNIAVKHLQVEQGNKEIYILKNVKVFMNTDKEEGNHARNRRKNETIKELK
jgi:hypothetical protein